MQILCWALDRIKSFLEIYQHTKAYHIKLKVEVKECVSLPKSASSQKPDDQSKDNRKDKDKDDSSDDQPLPDEE